MNLIKNSSVQSYFYHRIYPFEAFIQIDEILAPSNTKVETENIN
jgi:hypothetical protein